MSLVYTWSFPEFNVAPSADGLTNVVQVIHWRYTAVDGGYSASSYGSIRLGPPNPTDFIPYSQLTEQWTINAVSAQVDVPQMEIDLAQNIEYQKHPPTVPLPPPFPQ